MEYNLHPVHDQQQFTQNHHHSSASSVYYVRQAILKKILNIIIYLKNLLIAHTLKKKEGADWTRPENESTHLHFCTQSDIDKPVVVGVQYYHSLNRQTETGKPWMTDDLDTVITVKTPHRHKEKPAHLL